MADDVDANADKPTDMGTVAHGADGAAVDESKSAPEDRADAGPYDAKEIPSMRPYVDLGSLKIAPREGLKLRLDVDQKAKRVVAVSLDYADSTLQLQAFSAPKSTGLWHQIRAQIISQVSAQGAQVREREGTLGPEILTTITLPESRGGGVAPVRFIGVDGPRWLLRGAITGLAAQEPGAAAEIDALFREMVVIRGEQPMPPNELLPLKVPAGTQAKSE